MEIYNAILFAAFLLGGLYKGFRDGFELFDIIAVVLYAAALVLNIAVKIRKGKH